jgi:Protein ChrB, N-terminal
VVTRRTEPHEWVLLVYRLPREPSTPRIAVWRRLRRLGAAQLLDGLVGLPLDARNKEQLEWVAEQVVEAGGRAAVWMGRLSTRSDEASLVRSLSEATAADYRALIAQAGRAVNADAGGRRRTLQRLRRELRRIQHRDHFPPPEAEEARRLVAELGAHTEVAR